MPLLGNRQVDRAVVNFQNDWLVQMDKARKQFEPVWLENWMNYSVTPYGAGSSVDAWKLGPYKAGLQHDSILQLKSPESHQNANTVRAVLLGSLFGVRDYIQASPRGDEDADAAIRVSDMTMYSLDRPGNYRTNWDTLGDGVVFGTGYYQARWKFKTRTVPRRVPVLDEDGQPLVNPETGLPMTVIQRLPQIIHDDAELATHSLYDVWPDMSADRMADASGIQYRIRMSRQDLLDKIGQPGWDTKGIHAVLRTESGTSGDSDWPSSRDDDPKMLLSALTSEDLKEFDGLDVYGGWFYEGELPKDTATKVGLDVSATNELISFNGISVYRAMSNQRDGELSFGTISILPTGRGMLNNLSPLTVTRFLQDVQDTQLILTVQALIESVYQNYIISGDIAGPNLKAQIESKKPREAFIVDGEVSQIAPLPRDYTGIQIGVSALALISQTMRNAANARDPVQGIQQQGETTATETQVVAAAALQNVDQLAVLIERDELPRQGKLINDLNYMNLDDEGKVFRRIGSDTSQSVNFFDIDAVTDIQFIGARSALSKAQKGNQLRDFVAILFSHPVMAAHIDFEGFIKVYQDEALDIKGLERILIKDPEEVVARLQAMSLTSGGGAGTPGKSETRTTGDGTPAQNAGRSAAGSVV